MANRKVAEDFGAELAGLITGRRELVLRLTALEAWALYCSLQLAARHPACSGELRELVGELAAALEKRIATTKTFRTIADLLRVTRGAADMPAPGASGGDPAPEPAAWRGPETDAEFAAIADAFLAGLQAGLAGYPAGLNPYEPGDLPLHRAWNGGHGRAISAERARTEEVSVWPA